MEYFSPHFKIATLAEEQNILASKIGGIPWGLPSGKWPHCCGKPEKLLAQFCHEPPILDLGAPGAVLHLFQCLECLGINECGRDAFILNRSELTDAFLVVPGFDDKPDLGQRLIGEIFIVGWDQHDDGIPGSRLPEFFDEGELWSLQAEFPNINWFDRRTMTKFGGSPRWTGNGPMNCPPEPFEFLFQLDNYLCLDGSLPSPNEAGCEILEISQDGKSQKLLKPDYGKRRTNAPWLIIHEQLENGYAAEYTNLGTDGTVFAFINRSTSPHEVAWYWNR